MIQQTDKVRTNIRGMLLATVGFLIIAYYGSTALSTRDALWFAQGFTERPERMIVYHDGQRTELTAAQPAFAELADAVVASLDKGVNYASGVGFSQGSIDDAYNMYVTLEVFFARPVLLHASFGTGRPTQMLFPLTGRHSDRPLVLLGTNGIYLANAPILKTVEPIRAILGKQGYLP
jgi:hypothetical protein